MLNLQTSAQIVVITNEDKEFEKTPYANHKFAVYMRTLSSTERFKALEKATTIIKGKEEIDFLKLNLELLYLAIEKWEGLYADNKEIECNKTNIKNLFEFSQDFSQRLLNAYNRKTQIEDKKKA